MHILYKHKHKINYIKTNRSSPQGVKNNLRKISVDQFKGRMWFATNIWVVQSNASLQNLYEYILIRHIWYILEYQHDPSFLNINFGNRNSIIIKYFIFENIESDPVARSPGYICIWSLNFYVCFIQHHKHKLRLQAWKKKKRVKMHLYFCICILGNEVFNLHHVEKVISVLRQGNISY